MVKRKKSLAFLDTHIVIWLYSKLLHKLSDKAKDTINTHDVVICPIIALEMQYLYEIGRITEHPENILKYLQKTIGLKFSDSTFSILVDKACEISWTRDVFDRIIVADTKLHHSMGYDTCLISCDRIIKEYYKLYTIW